MKSLIFTFLFVSTIVMALLASQSSATQTKQKIGSNSEELLPENVRANTASYRGSSRFLGRHKPYYQNPIKGGGPRAHVTCDNFPRICHVKGSPGHDCCRKKCVNVRTDNLNCGMCGLKCRYPETCCNGRCVNTLHDRKNCGGCHNKCKRGSVCYYGMCSYA